MKKTPNSIFKNVSMTFYSIPQRLYQLTLVLCFLMSSNFSIAQCPPGNVSLYTQGQVNAFASTYPNCTIINGNLNIEGNDITDLSPLENITSISGSLFISSNPSLSNIAMPSLYSIGRSLFIISNSSLSNIAMPSLYSIGLGSNISSNPSLSNMAMPSLYSIGNSLTIISNPLLSNMAMPSLYSIGRNLSIRSNLSLSNIEMSALYSVGFNIWIRNNNALSAIEMSALYSVIIFIQVVNNPNLSHCAIRYNCFGGPGAFVGNDCGCNSLQEVQLGCFNRLDIDGDGYKICEGDCDDYNDAIYPGAPEVCDGVDNNCNNQIDEGVGLCIDCDSYGLSTQNGYINQIEVYELDNLSGNDNGYGDYTNMTAYLLAGISVPIKVTPNNANNQYWRVWIDFNQNGDFTDAGDMIFEGNNYSSMSNVMIPINATLGTTKMRVSMKYGEYPFPCGTFDEGEVEDYTVVIVQPTLGTCTNVTNAGQIDGNQALCGINYSPTILNNVATATGGNGALLYRWIKTTFDPTANPNSWQVIPGTNSVSYTPGYTNQTTWFMRQAKRSGCTDYKSSNTVEVSYQLTCSPSPTNCPSAGQSTSNGYINYVWLGSLYNTSGDDGGYGDYTSISGIYPCGQSYPANLIATGTSTKYWRIWIDFNQDGDLMDPGEMVFEKSGIGNIAGMYYIPVSAMKGKTKMRVSMKEGSYPTPCEIFSDGEVEDYSMEIYQLKPTNNTDIKIYPNPAKDQTLVEMNGLAGLPGTVHISNHIGQAVYSRSFKQLPNQPLAIDVFDYKSGVYFVSVVADGKHSITKRLVVVSKNNGSNYRKF